MPVCINDNNKNYSGKEKSPLGLGYSATNEPLNKIMLGKDNECYIVKLVKSTGEHKWSKINDLEDFFNNLPEEYYNKGYIPKCSKINEETGLEEKFGGKYPFFVKGEKWPSKGNYHMTFFCQLKDPRKNDNILYRVFILIDDNDINDDFWITKIELNDENIKNQVLIKKPKYPDEFFDRYSKEEIFEPYQINSWKVFNDIKNYNYLRQHFCIPDYIYQGNNTLYNKFSDAYHSNGPKPGIKVGGTPLSTQDQEFVQSFDFLQIEYSTVLPYMWGDVGIAHVSDDCDFTWDCC